MTTAVSNSTAYTEQLERIAQKLQQYRDSKNNVNSHIKLKLPVQTWASWDNVLCIRDKQNDTSKIDYFLFRREANDIALKLQCTDNGLHAQYAIEGNDWVSIEDTYLPYILKHDPNFAAPDHILENLPLARNHMHLLDATEKGIDRMISQKEELDKEAQFGGKVVYPSDIPKTITSVFDMANNNPNWIKYDHIGQRVLKLQGDIESVPVQILLIEDRQQDYHLKKIIVAYDTLKVEVTLFLPELDYMMDAMYYNTERGVLAKGWIHRLTDVQWETFAQDLGLFAWIEQHANGVEHTPIDAWANDFAI